MYYLLLLLIAIAPPLIAVKYIQSLDKKRAHPKKKVLKIFLLGLLITIPAVILEMMLIQIQRMLHFVGIFEYLFKSFVAIGFSEEFFKLLVVIVFVYNRREFNEFMDGIIYAIVASLGFSCMENIFYAFTGGIGVGIMRIFTALPIHIISSGILGYYIGKAKFSNSKLVETGLIYKGLLYAVLIHGFYDFLLLANPEMYLYASIGIFLLLVFTATVLFQKIKIAAQKDFNLNGVALIKV